MVRRVDEPLLAADLTAEVFLAAIDAAPAYRLERGAPGAWLLGIARNLVAAEHRRAGRERRANARIEGRRLLEPDDIARMQERIDAESRARALYTALDGLPEAERAVFELHALDGLSPSEAAAVLGIRPVTARVRLHRARTALRSRLRGARRPGDHATDGGPTMSTTHSFEDRLLHELRLVVAEQPAPVAVPARRGRRLRRPLLGVGVVAATTAAIAVLASSGDRTPSAYAVQSQANGAVSVTIHSLKDATGLQRKLRAAGVPAVVDYAAGGVPCVAGATPPEGGASGTMQVEKGAGTPPPVGAAPEGGAQQSFHTEKGEAGGPTLDGPAADGAPPAQVRAASSVKITPDGATFTIDPGALETGQHVYITTSTGAVTTIAMSVAKTKPQIPCPPAP